MMERARGGGDGSGLRIFGRTTCQIFGTPPQWMALKVETVDTLPNRKKNSS
jgi:hypothetical protein